VPIGSLVKAVRLVAGNQVTMELREMEAAFA